MFERAVALSQHHDGITNNTHYIVTVHNGNSQTLTTLVKVPLYQNLNSVNITDGNGNPISSQINSVFINPGQINNTDISVNEICFVANVGPLGFQTYFLSLPTKTEFSKKDDKNVKDGTNTKSISNGTRWNHFI
uniref:Alpha-mannosidase n=1 Tax=Acrobeloides nanus TaxID=290746 RepID=A0A914BUC2_9BILA